MPRVAQQVARKRHYYNAARMSSTVSGEEDWFCFLLFSLVGVSSPWGQNTVVLSPCLALCGLDLAILCTPWGQDERPCAGGRGRSYELPAWLGRAVGVGGATVRWESVTPREQYGKDENGHAQLFLSQESVLRTNAQRYIVQGRISQRCVEQE